MAKSQTLRKHNQQPGLSRLEQLSDDVLLSILFFLPTMAEIARTSILCRRLRKLWLNVTCLDFDATAVLPRDRVRGRRHWYISWVNNVLEARAALPGLPSVKELRIRYSLSASTSCHIDRWIDFAIVNQVETLHLEFSPYLWLLPANSEYNLTEDSWYKAPSGLSSLRCLKSLFLRNVNVTKQFIEFVLSNCPLLEDLSLHHAGTYNGLNVTRAPPLKLRRLNMDAGDDYALNKLCAPHLTSLYYKSLKFNPQQIDVPVLNDLAIGGFYQSQPIMEYLEHFWNYLPQLEKLHLIMEQDWEFRLDPIPGLVKLKYLMISVCWDTNPFFAQLVRFLEACTSLETFEFQMLFGRVISMPNEQNCYRMEVLSGRFQSLKVLKLYGNEGKTLDQEIVKFIIKNSPYLEKLHVDVQSKHKYRELWPSEPKIGEVAEVKAKELCRGRASEVEITVFA